VGWRFQCNRTSDLAVRAELRNGDLAVPVAWLCAACRAIPGALEAFEAELRAAVAEWPEELVIREHPGVCAAAE
jgi:hypothetical protein